MNNDDVTSFNKPDRTTLDNTDVEALGHAVLTLTHELWVLTDRLVTLEALLEKKEVISHHEVDAFQPDEKLQDSLNTKARTLVSRVVGSLSGKSDK